MNCDTQVNNQVSNTKLISINKKGVNTRGFDLELENQGFDKLEVQLGCDNKQGNRDLESDLEIITESNETHLDCDIEQRNRDLGSELEKMWMNVELQLIDQVPIKGLLNLVHRG